MAKRNLDNAKVAKKGVNSGKEFWSCSGYPECNGTRKI